MDLTVLAARLREATGQPMMLSLQAANVNSGSFESFAAIADLVQGENAWLHVDGAFGLWAAVSPKTRPLTHGMERADSWSTDAHKWLNVPCDSGVVIIRDAAAHRRLKVTRCAYAGEVATDHRDGSAWVPENSRRARGFVLYAVLREYGRTGLCALVERCCRLARDFAAGIAALPGAEVLNEVGLSQVLFRFKPPGNVAADTFHRTIAEHIQTDGECWIGTTSWRGETVLRISITNAFTREADVAAGLASLAQAVRQAASITDCP